MLKRRIGQFLGLILIAVGAVVVTPTAALADYIYCPPDSGPCYIVVTGSGGGGGGGGGGSGGGGGTAKCFDPQLGQIPCHKAGLGWYNPTDGCYYDRLDLSINDPIWGSHDPSKGDMYNVWCWAGAAAGWELSGIRYLTNAPPGYGGLPSPLQLALRAINNLPIRGAVIGSAPGSATSGRAGLVGLHVWLWTAVRADTWGPAEATASVPGLSVTAVANATKIVWTMGDRGSVTCKNPGTPYKSSYGDKASPNCGYVYKTSSRNQSGGRYAIVATTYWHVTWSGGGDSGYVDIQRTSNTTLRIDELQAVTK
ncbi:MAG: hypothetical protein HOV83_18015 [Catenulispora sp.]|nr:hypothetical protein [Catenulispora sp.]